MRRSSPGLPMPFLAAAFAALSLPAQAAAPQSFYAGKTVTVVSGEPAGGGSDTYARLLARHLGRHIPGAPAIIVQNMPGAGTLKAVMYVGSTAPSDGTVLATFSSAGIEQALIAPERTPVDFRSFSWIGNISEDARVCYTGSASGIRDWKDFVSRPKPVFMGASAPGAAGTGDLAILENLLGANIHEVQGYAGGAEKRLAVERHEIDGECTGWTAIPADSLRDKKVNVVMRLSPTLVAGMDKTVPFGGDLTKSAQDRALYEFLTAPERLGRVFMLSGKAPPDRVAALRAAFDATMTDPQFLAEAQKMRLLVTPMTGDEVTRRIRDLYATPPGIIARAKAITGGK